MGSIRRGGQEYDMKRAALILATAIMLVPLYMLVAGAFMDEATLTADPPRLWPRPFDFTNFVYWYERAPAMVWLTNTSLIVVASAALSVVVTGAAGYSFGMLKWRGQRALFWTLMAGVMIPGQVLFVARFVWFNRLGMMRLPLGVIVMYIAAPVNIFLVRNYMRSVPQEMRDSARIDGCGEWRTFVHVILPLCLPIIAIVALGGAMGGLNDYLWQMLLTENTPRETLIVGIQRITKELVHQRQSGGFFRNVAGINMAGAVILAVPICALFFISQRYYRGGLIVGSVKE